MTPRTIFCLIVGFGAPATLLVADWSATLPSPWPFAVLAASAVCLWVVHADLCPYCRCDRDA